MSPAPAWPYGPRACVCVSLAELDVASLQASFERLAGADLAEIRLDALGGTINSETINAELLRALVGACPVPVGFTLRPAWQGGAFTGSEADRRAVLEQAAAVGAAFIDVELDAAWAADLIDRAPCPVVVSHHWLETPVGDLEDLDARVRRAREIGASMVKLVGTAEASSDAVPLLRAGRQLIEEGQPATCFCMGEAGRVSRLLAVARGAALVYAAAETGREVAPGQWPLRALVQEMGVRGWSEDGALFGLIGHPIEHSLSPAVFNAAFRRQGVNAAYLPVPGADLEDSLALLEEAGFRGVSVTMPFKEQMAARAAHKDFVVEATGAANTMVFADDGWHAYNTDGEAVVDALRTVCDLVGARVVIVGAGGAARAAAAALVRAGCDVTVVNRTAQRAAECARAAGAVSGPIETMESTVFDVVINATPVGMNAGTSTTATSTDAPPPTTAAQATPFPPRWLRGSEVVLDMVYRPRETTLLRSARQRGCTIVEGLEMFVRQAAAQYLLLTGESVEAPLATMREAAEIALSHDTVAAERTFPDRTTRE